MKTEFSSSIWPLFVGGFFIVIATILIFNHAFEPAVFFFIIGAFFFLIGFSWIKIKVLDDSIIMIAQFGFVEDRIYFSEITDLNSSARSGIVNLGDGIQTDSYRKSLNIKLKTGEEYNVTNSEIENLDELIATINEKMEKHTSSQ